jgi:hypothetical protein
MSFDSMTASSNWIAALRPYLATVAGADLVWEAAHLPLYTLWRTATTRDQLFAVIHCTLGDILIALTCLVVALILAGHRAWPIQHFTQVAILTLLFGLGYTVFSEWLNVVVRKSWAYSEFMPVVPLFGWRIGASPLLQWIVVPLIALLAARRGGAPRARARVPR